MWFGLIAERLIEVLRALALVLLLFLLLARDAVVFMSCLSLICALFDPLASEFKLCSVARC